MIHFFLGSDSYSCNPCFCRAAAENLPPCWHGWVGSPGTARISSALLQNVILIPSRCREPGGFLCAAGEVQQKSPGYLLCLRLWGRAGIRQGNRGFWLLYQWAVKYNVCQALSKDLLKTRLEGWLWSVLISTKIPFKTDCQAQSVLKMSAFGKRLTVTFFLSFYILSQK